MFVIPQVVVTITYCLPRLSRGSASCRRTMPVRSAAVRSGAEAQHTCTAPRHGIVARRRGAARYYRIPPTAPQATPGSHCHPAVVVYSRRPRISPIRGEVLTKNLVSIFSRCGHNTISGQKWRKVGGSNKNNWRTKRRKVRFQILTFGHFWKPCGFVLTT
jgi:hypothetical protein